MKASTMRKIKDLGLNHKEFTTDGSASLEGRIVLADPKDFGKSKDKCLFTATGGFGCSPNARGSCIFVSRVSDGAAGRIDRSDIIAVHV
jgi:hypothetical protein